MEIDLPGETITKIADLTTFKTMKNDVTANFSWIKNLDNEKGEATFMRKGVVGDWKNYLSAEQSAQMDRKCAQKLDLEFDYE